jgi:di/tricarboxylate transporter
MATRSVAIPLFVLALLAVSGLVAAGAGLVAVNGLTGTMPLWYVAIVGGFLGGSGTAAYSRKAGPAKTS